MARVSTHFPGTCIRREFKRKRVSSNGNSTQVYVHCYRLCGALRSFRDSCFSHDRFPIEVLELDRCSTWNISTSAAVRASVPSFPPVYRAFPICRDFYSSRLSCASVCNNRTKVRPSIEYWHLGPRLRRSAVYFIVAQLFSRIPPAPGGRNPSAQVLRIS